MVKLRRAAAAPIATVLSLVALAHAAFADTAPSGIDREAAAAAFAEAHSLCSADDGRLWGVSLCGPMMFVDPQTHAAVANEPVTGGARDGSLYRFTLPADMGTSNTSLEYGGTRWTMIRWPLTTDPDTRAVLLMHESYHRIQPQVGLVGSGGLNANGHLDSEQGRVWLRGEMHALAAALNASGSARVSALRDALVMAAYRHSLFAGSAEQEQQLEINEGLAESTGIDAGLSADKRIPYALHDLASLERAPSYVREFPYGIGPAYAELLDAASPDWRKGVTQTTDLGTLAAERYAIAVPVPDAATAGAALARHEGATIQAEEHARGVALAQRDRRYTRELIDGPTLTLPLRHMQITFDPTAVESFAEHGSVYHTLHVGDDWGVLELSSGDALIGPRFDRIVVVAPRSGAGAPSGPGWTLRLAPGYVVAPDPGKPGSSIVTRATAPQ